MRMHSTKSVNAPPAGSLEWFKAFCMVEDNDHHGFRQLNPEKPRSSLHEEEDSLPERQAPSLADKALLSETEIPDDVHSRDI